MKNKSTEKTASKPAWKKAVIGAAGVAAGIGGVVAGSDLYAQDNDNQENEGELENAADAAEVQEPEMEELSFSQAFAQARSQMGPGQEFEWNGRMYSTDLKEESDNDEAADDELSVEEAQEVSVEEDQETNVEEAQEASVEEVQEVSAEEVVNVEESVEINAETGDEDSEIEILGVSQDTVDSEEVLEPGANSLDGEDVIVVEIESEPEPEVVPVFDNDMPEAGPEIAYEEPLVDADYTNDAVIG